MKWMSIIREKNSYSIVSKRAATSTKRTNKQHSFSAAAATTNTMKNCQNSAVSIARMECSMLHVNKNRMLHKNCVSDISKAWIACFTIVFTIAAIAVSYLRHQAECSILPKIESYASHFTACKNMACYLHCKKNAEKTHGKRIYVMLGV